MRAVLTYHSIDRSGSPISLDPDVFRSHVDFLASGPVTVLPLGQILEAGVETEPAVALTFDDGFSNFGTVAWPALAERELPATVFVVSGRTGGENDWTAPGIPDVPRLPLLDWSDLGRLAETGAELGCHTRRHPDLAALPRDQLIDEIDGAAEDLARETGQTPRHFAYPFGRYDAAVLDVVRARYSLAVTTEMHWLVAGQSPHRLPRLDMFYYREPGRLESIGSAGFRGRIRFLAAARTLRGRVSSIMRRG